MKVKKKKIIGFHQAFKKMSAQQGEKNESRELKTK